MITIVDYGMGNLGSVQNMFRKVGATAEITSDLQKIRDARKILLPGVGAFDAAMKQINETGLREVLTTKATVDKVPVLGICLGMQLMTNASEEGVLPGLGWIDAVTRRFPASPGLKVPHMGWNILKPLWSHALLNDLPEEPRFYFVHSYFVTTSLPAETIATTSYGSDFAAVIARDNIMGAQFHPERSHRFGARLLENFAHI